MVIEIQRLLWTHHTCRDRKWQQVSRPRSPHHLVVLDSIDYHDEEHIKNTDEKYVFIFTLTTWILIHKRWFKHEAFIKLFFIVLFVCECSYCVIKRLNTHRLILHFKIREIKILTAQTVFYANMYLCIICINIPWCYMY